MKKLFFSLFILFFLTGFLFAQTQDEKKPQKERVITNKTLREIKRNISIMGREEEIKEESQIESLEEKSAVEVKDEKYWRNLKKEMEEKIDQAIKKVKDLKEKLNDLYRDFYATEDPARRDSIQVQIVETTRKVEEAEEELEKAKKDFEDFKERARKEGALPGWLR